MNEWLTLLSAWTSAWQLQLAPWMPWVDEGLQGLKAVLQQVPALVWAGAALWLAMSVADVAQRWGLLRSTAYGLCGAVLALAIALASSAQDGMALVMRSEGLLDMALGWIVFMVGQQMDMRWLLRNKALAATAVLDFVFTALAVTAVLIMLGLAWPAAGVAGLLMAHSSPVVLASYMPDWQADGQISARALHMGGINTLLAALSVPLVLALAQAWLQSAAQSMHALTTVSLPILQRSGWEMAQPLLLLMLSLAVGTALGRLLARPAHSAQSAWRWLAAEGSMAWVAAACVCAGLAQWWGAPAWAACLALGLSLRSPSGAAWRAGLGLQQSLTSLAQLLLFALSAAILIALALQSSSAFSQVALMLLLRLVCKLLVCTLTARWAGLRWQQGFALGLAMQPLSMTGLALLLMAWPLLMQGDALMACSLVAALGLSDWLAPKGLRALLRRSGEMVPDEIAGLRSKNSTQPVRIDTSAQPQHPIHVG
jgi:Kef-type K+ transport system membrane component KefB